MDAYSEVPLHTVVSHMDGEHRPVDAAAAEAHIYMVDLVLSRMVMVHTVNSAAARGELRNAQHHHTWHVQEVVREVAAAI